MDSVFQELKRAREGRRLSINDVSDATLINARFLEAIESGNTNILPQTYVRAFIREYASVVGLDPVEIMRRYDQARTDSETLSPVPIPVPPTPARLPEQKPLAEPVSHTPHRGPSVAKFALPGIVILTLAVVIWNLTRTKVTEPRETPIEHTLNNSEAAPDSVAKKPSKQKTPLGTVDSLSLHATITDSAWVEIVIDDRTPQQYLFRPNRKISWKAKQRFRITTGNAGAIDLTLNDRHLGPLGKKWGIARNVELNRQTLLKK